MPVPEWWYLLLTVNKSVMKRNVIGRKVHHLKGILCTYALWNLVQYFSIDKLGEKIYYLITGSFVTQFTLHLILGLIIHQHLPKPIIYTALNCPLKSRYSDNKYFFIFKLNFIVFFHYHLPHLYTPPLAIIHCCPSP